jgi:D-alanine-D-alanine ligase
VPVNQSNHQVRRWSVLRIAIVTNSSKTRLAKYDPNSRLQAEVTCKAVSSALAELDYEIQVIEAGPTLVTDLENAWPDAVFNIATGYHTKKQQANIAAMLELTGIPFTGSGSRGHMIGLLKHIAKMNFEAHGVLTPRFQVINDVHELTGNSVTLNLPFPVIVKPAAEGSSVGISSESVTDDPVKAKELTALLLNDLEPPVLIEEFIPGREFTVALVGYPEPAVLPVEEIVFKEESMYTYGVKIRDNITAVCPAEISEKLNQDIQNAALRAFQAIGCRDIARVDIRVSEDGRPFVLEINTLPGLMPKYSEVPRIAEKAEIGYPELIESILKGALKRRATDPAASVQEAAGL